ncbi:hypothetical protein EVJ58_g10342, partial [Rhodofomes roseus]
MSSTTSAISAGPSNAPTSGNSRKRALSDSEGTSDRENARTTHKRAKGTAVVSDAHRGGPNEKKRKRKRKRKHPAVEAADAPRPLPPPVVNMSSPKLPRKRSRSGAKKAAANTSVAGPSSRTMAAAHAMQDVPGIASSPTAKTASPELGSISPPSTATSLKGKEKASPTSPSAVSVATSALAVEVASLKAQLAAKTELSSKQGTLLSALHQSLTCQICLDPLHKPYALAPCGHIACHGCLIAWFQAPPADAHPHDVLPVLLRKKTCPHCRTVVRERPIEVWAVKDMVG